MIAVKKSSDRKLFSFLEKNILAYPKTNAIKKLLNEVLLWIYTFNTIFVPYDNFMLKKLSFVMLIMLNILGIVNYLFRGRESMMIVVFGIIMPIYTIVKSYALTGNLTGNLMSGYTGMIILLYYVIKKYKINYGMIFNVCLLMLASFICVSVIMDFVGFMSVFQNPVLRWMHLTDNAEIGKGGQYFSGYYIFIKTTPMMIVGVAYQIDRKNIPFALLLLAALILSGTRGNAILGLGVFAVCFVLKEERRFNRILIIVLTIIAALYFIIKFDLFSVYSKYADTKGSGDKIRKTTLPSIFMSWQEKPLSFLTGQGYTSEFYNFGRQKYESDVELSYWNLLRRVGLGCFIVMMAGYLYPAFSMLKKKIVNVKALAYIAYLAGCYVNPLLYTSTGVTVLLYMFCIAFINQDDEKRNNIMKMIRS